MPFLHRKNRKRKMRGLTARCVEELVHFSRCVWFATQPIDRERMFKSTPRDSAPSALCISWGKFSACPSSSFRIAKAKLLFWTMMRQDVVRIAKLCWACEKTFCETGGWSTLAEGSRRSFTLIHVVRRAYELSASKCSQSLQTSDSVPQF